MKSFQRTYVLKLGKPGNSIYNAKDVRCSYGVLALSGCKFKTRAKKQQKMSEKIFHCGAQKV